MKKPSTGTRTRNRDRWAVHAVQNDEYSFPLQHVGVPIQLPSSLYQVHLAISEKKIEEERMNKYEQ